MKVAVHNDANNVNKIDAKEEILRTVDAPVEPNENFNNNVTDQNIQSVKGKNIRIVVAGRASVQELIEYEVISLLMQ